MYQIVNENLPWAGFVSVFMSETPSLLGVDSAEFASGRFDGAVGADDARSCSMFSLEEHPAPSSHPSWVLAFLCQAARDHVHGGEESPSLLVTIAFPHPLVPFVVCGLGFQWAVSAE